MSTEETGLPLGIVSERRCEFPIGEDAEGKEYDDMDGDITLWLPFASTWGRLSLRRGEDTGAVVFSGGTGGEEGEAGTSGRERCLDSGT